MKHYIIEMPDEWKPQVCGLCWSGYACHANNGVKVNGVDRCPLANAKEAVEANVDISNKGIRQYVCVLKKDIKLWVTEDK